MMRSDARVAFPFDGRKEKESKRKRVVSLPVAKRPRALFSADSFLTKRSSTIYSIERQSKKSAYSATRLMLSS